MVMFLNLPLPDTLNSKSMSFLINLQSSPNLILRLLYQLTGHEDMFIFPSMFHSNNELFCKYYKHIVRNHFNHFETDQYQ